MIKTIIDLDQYSDSTVQITISSLGSRFHWVKQSLIHGITVVDQGFATTLLNALFEAEI